MADYTLTRTEPDGWLLNLTGDWDVRHAQGLYDGLSDAMPWNAPLRIDLTSVTSLDSAIVQLILALRRQVESHGGTWEWQGVSAAVSEFIAALGLVDAALPTPAPST